MTTIAFDGITLACDSAWTLNDTFTSSKTKLIRLPTGALYAAAGHIDDRDLVALLRDTPCSYQMPDGAALDAITSDLRALVIFPSGDVWLIDTGGEYCGAMPIHSPCVAIGSGANIALGAMDAGADAKRAIEIACNRDAYTRGPVHTMTLGESNL